jgi:hypothetical protein
MADEPSNAGARIGAHACLSDAQGGDTAEPDLASSAAKRRHARFSRFAQRARTWAQRSGVGGKVGPRAGVPLISTTQQAQRVRRCVVQVVVWRAAGGRTRLPELSNRALHGVTRNYRRRRSRIRERLSTLWRALQQARHPYRCWLGIGIVRLGTSARPELSISSRHMALASESPLRLPAPAFCFEDANLKQPERMGSYVAGRGLARAREFAHPQSRCPRLEVACPASNSSCEAAHQHTATRCMSMRTNTHTLTVACASAQAQTGTRVRARFPMLQLTCVTRVVVAKHY